MALEVGSYPLLLAFILVGVVGALVGFLVGANYEQESRPNGH